MEAKEGKRKAEKQRHKKETKAKGEVTKINVQCKKEGMEDGILREQGNEHMQEREYKEKKEKKQEKRKVKETREGRKGDSFLQSTTFSVLRTRMIFGILQGLSEELWKVSGER